MAEGTQNMTQQSAKGLATWAAGFGAEGWRRRIERLPAPDVFHAAIDEIRHLRNSQVIDAIGDLADQVAALTVNAWRIAFRRVDWLYNIVENEMQSDEEERDEAAAGYSQPNYELIDRALVDQPVLPPNRRSVGCFCQRCPRLLGEEHRCCGRNSDDCMSLKWYLSVVLYEQGAIPDAIAEAAALLIGKPVGKWHRYQCYDMVWSRYLDHYERQGPRVKIPDCVEGRIHEKFPGDYTGFKQRPGHPYGRGGQRGGGHRGGRGGNRGGGHRGGRGRMPALC